MRHWLSTLGEVFWPRGLKCMCCDELSEGNALCPACRKALRALRLDRAEAGEDGIRSVYRYDGTAKALVLLLKGSCLVDAAEVLAADMYEAMKTMAIPPDTVLTWVTMPAQRLRVRGIDHGRALCEALGRISGMPVRQLLTRKGKLHTQRGLSKEARLQNLSGTLMCEEPLSRPVLLVDDVLTTGATASACAEVLMAAGARAVYVLTATRVMLKKIEDQKG